MLKSLRQGMRNITQGSRDNGAPIVSFVLIVYDMPKQAENTVRSLMTDYQRDVVAGDYELLIIENASSNNMDLAFIASLPAHFSYHLRQETQPTPIHAINYGIERASGRNICVMIDGSRVLSPGVVKNVLLGHRISDLAVVTVPGYHLGEELQQKAVSSGYDEHTERTLMESIRWPEDGYRLFDIACFSGSCAAGFYLPHSESNCISLLRRLWEDLGGFDARFDARGGGVVNLDTFKRACEYPGAVHVFLHGEGTFHQFHGGVTTGGEDAETRQRFIDQIMAQYEEIRGGKYQSPVTNPVYLGELSDPAQRFVSLSSKKKMDTLTAQPEIQRVSA